MSQAYPYVVLDTTMGEIILEINTDKAPETAENFLAYVREGFYDGTIFHRVIKGFMVQGGGLTADMHEKPTREPIRNEARNGLKNKEGTIAMARTMEVDSATSQFFINTADNKFLDNTGTSPESFGYAVFGKVVDGMNVVYDMERVATTSRAGHDDVPVEPVVIRSASVVE